MTGRDNQEKTTSIQFSCPSCESEFHLALELDGAPGAGKSCCPGCGFLFESSFNEAGFDLSIDGCAVCGCEEFYVQKDFNRQLGLMVAVSSLMAVFLLMVLVGHLAGLFCLFGLAAIDFLIYSLWKNATVCYLCHSIYRGFRQDPVHKGFYLGNEEKYKHLRRGWIDGIGAATEEKASTSRKTPGGGQ